jgi:peptide/nickel transport system substrate-binding protein
VLASTTPGYIDLSARLKHDPTAAKARLDRAGWTTGGDGIRSRGGKKLALTLVYSASERYGTVYQLMAQQLRDIGVDLRLKPLDDATNSARQAAGDYDFVSWAVTRADPTILASIFPVASANPLRRTQADEVDALIRRSSAVAAGPRRERAVSAAVDAILTRAHGIPLFEQASSVGLAEGVTGVRLDASSRPLFYAAEVSR